MRVALEPSSTIQAFCDLLAVNDACGVPDPAASYFQMQRWWEIGSIRDALRHIEDTEGGFAFEDRLGNIGLQSAGHRASQTVGKTFTGLATPLAGEIAVVGRPKRDIAVKDVVNEVVGYTRQYETVLAQTVFQRRDPIQIDRGGSVTLFADFVGEGGGAVSDLDTPASGTDYTAHAAMDGSGNDRASLLDVTAEISQFNEVKVVVNYPVSPGVPAELFITLLDLKGSDSQEPAPGQGAKAKRSIDREVQAQDSRAAGYLDSEPSQHGGAGGCHPRGAGFS